MIAVVGASGAVGREMLALLAARGVPPHNIVALASARSAGATLDYGDAQVAVRQLTDASFDGVDTALFAAGADISRRYAAAVHAAGARLIDNSSAFRLDVDVPLVVPEVNGDVLDDGGAAPIIANPNCSAIILATALAPLRRAFGIERLVVSTYQAASGAGAAAMRELADQTAAVLAGERASPSVFAEPCAFNVFSHDTQVDLETGRNVEEQKVIDEMRKIFNDDALRLSVTCIRVPVLRAHAASVNVALATPATEVAVRAVLDTAPSVTLHDGRAHNDFPTSLKASGGDNVLVGRLRADRSQPSQGNTHYGYELFIAGDQLRKGAALNALQICDLIDA